MKNINIQKATSRTRFNRACEKKGSKYTFTFTNAIDGARAFTGVNKKHSTRGLNAVITEGDFRRECKEGEAERLLKALVLADDEQQQSDDDQQRKATRLAK